MDIKRIAGISIDLDKKDSLYYDQLVKMALSSKEYQYKSKKEALKLIKAELKVNGISKGNKKSNSASGPGGEAGQPNTGEQGADNKEGSSSMEEGASS